MSPSEATGFAVMTSRRAGTNSRLECRRAFDLMGEGFVLILQIEAIKLPLDLAADDPLIPQSPFSSSLSSLAGVALALMTPAKAALAMSISGTPAINSHTSGVRESH